jgi:hypothetical protein
VDPNTPQGQVTVTVRVAVAPMLALSSMARTRRPVAPMPGCEKEYDQLVVPFAGRQVSPASVETSTPATRPPPVSVAVPVSVVCAPWAMLAPPAGAVTVTVGPVRSVDLVAGESVLSSVVGWALMSASRLTWACCIRRSAGSGA